MLSYLFRSREVGRTREVINPRKINDEIHFLRDIQQGQLRRWMIIVQSVRTMLLRQADGSYRLETDTVPGWTSQGECDQLRRERRAAGNPEDNGVLCMRIAYTSLPQHQIADCFNAVRSRFPAYFSWTQCQDFLRQFVNGIFDHANNELQSFLDTTDFPIPYNEWQWFLDNTDVSRHRVMFLPPIPAPILAALEERRRQNQYRGPNLQLMSNLQMGVAMQIQQQNMQMNQQLMQNAQSNPGYGYGA